MWILSVAAVVALATTIGASTPQPVSSSEALCYRGYDLAYNLDFGEARIAFEQAAGAQPKDPMSYRGLATTAWLSILVQRGIISVDDYMGSPPSGDARVTPPPQAEASRFRQAIDRAVEIAEDEVHRTPNSAAAHYDVGAAVGLLATYTGTVEGRMLAGLRAARRAYNEQETVLSLDPRRRDAGLVVGTYRYVVASLPLYMRLVAYVVGFGGGRERGLQMVEQAAGYKSEAQGDALFALVLFYNRERRFDDALRVIRELKTRFPRNRLLWLEAGATELRARRAAAADAELTEGLERLGRDGRPRAWGEEALWHYKRGAARLIEGNQAGAEADLTAALATDGRTWVRGRARIEMGKLADLRGNRARATGEYQAAAALCEKSRDAEGAAEARALLATPYGKRR